MDTIARGLASKALVAQRTRGNLLRINDAIASAARKNPVTSPAMASPPTVTVGGAADAALTQIYTFASAGALIPASLTSAADKVNWLGGLPKACSLGAAAGSLVTQVTSTYYPNLDGNAAYTVGQGTVDPSLTADMNMVLGGFEFETAAPTVEVRLYNETNLRVCFQVDGEYVDKAGHTATTGTTVRSDYYKLAFGSEKVRRIRVMMTADPKKGSSGTNQGWQAVRSIAVTAGYIIWKPKRTPLRLGIFGDSYSTGVGGSSTSGTFQVPGQSFPQIMGDLLGFPDVRVFGIGSTGYVAAGNAGGGSNRLALPDAFPRFVSMYGGALDLDLAVIGHGYNDGVSGGGGGVVTGLQAAVDTSLGLIRAHQANLPIVVLGAQPGAKGPSAGILAAEAAIKAAVDARVAAGDNLIRFVAVSPDAVSSWTYGTGYVGATNGTDASNIDIGADGTHPTTTYAAKIGARGADGVRWAVSDMLAVAGQ